MSNYPKRPHPDRRTTKFISKKLFQQQQKYSLQNSTFHGDKMEQVESKNIYKKEEEGERNKQTNKLWMPKQVKVLFPFK